MKIKRRVYIVYQQNSWIFTKGTFHKLCGSLQFIMAAFGSGIILMTIVVCVYSQAMYYPGKQQENLGQRFGQ